MPYTLKTSQISVKDPETGEYSGVDIFAEQTEEGLIAELQAEGTKQVNRINQAAVNVQAAVDQAESDAAELISDTQESIDTLEAQKNTIAQTVASMAELGTDTTFTTPGMAADAKAVGDLSRQLNDETTGLDTKAPVIINTASGAIASFDDGADSMPIRKLVAQIEPVQDLHGYANPWPAGGGKNLLSIDPSIVTITKNEVTFTVNRNSDGDVTSVVANGTATNRTYFYLGYYNINGGTILNGAPSGGSQDAYALAFDGTSIFDYGNGSAIANDLTNNLLMIVIANGFVCNNLTFKPMIRLATEADSTFAPYSNICPISGHTGAEIEQTGKNLFDPQIFADYSGVLQADGSYYFASPNSLYMKHLWDNVNGYDGQLALTWIKKDDTTATTTTAYPVVYYTDGTVESVPVSLSTQGFSTATFVTSANKVVDYITCSYGTNKPGWYKLQLELGSAATTYEPYTGNQISVTFQSEAGTIYGGTLTINPDRTGAIIANMAFLTFGDLDWTYTSNIFVVYNTIGAKYRGEDALCSHYINSGTIQSSLMPDKSFQIMTGSNGLWVKDESYTDAASFKSAMSDVQICYELAEPQTFQLTAEQVSGILFTLYGTNNIWADTGDTEVEYPCDTRLYIDNKITQAIANALNS